MTQVKEIKLSELVVDPDLVLSKPPDPGLHEIFLDRFHGIPPIIADGEMRVISGHESLEILNRTGTEFSEVLIVDTTGKDSLFLAYNLRGALKPFSLYEKLCFIEKALHLSDMTEIYTRTGIGIKIDEDLIAALPVLTGSELSDPLSSGRLDLRTAVRISAMDPETRRIFSGIFRNVKLSSSHQQILLDLVEEICFRDKSGAEVVLRQAGAGEDLSHIEDGAGLIDAVLRIRYPEYTRAERQWKDTAGDIKFPFRFTVKHEPFFEKKGVELRIFMDSLEAVKELSEKLKG